MKRRLIIGMLVVFGLGLEVTALHNQFMWDEPRIFFMHVHGRGTPQELARKVVPIRQHMVGTTPKIYFLHYWGTGPADKLAAGFKAALDELGKQSPARGRQ
jgi:hypothetical protein